MNANEARTILAMVAGYWSTPAMTEEEATAWLRELAATPMQITFEEAQTVIDDMARGGGKFRPRPGELFVAVQSLRRYRKLMTPLPILNEGPVGYAADPAAFLEGLASVRHCLGRPTKGQRNI